MIDKLNPLYARGVRPVPVIPTIYTDALSYGEQLGIMGHKTDECVDKVNEIIEDNQTFKTDITEQQDEFEDTMQGQYDEFLENYQRQFGVVQETGTSITDVMSQKAVTDELNNVLYKPNDTFGIEGQVLESTGNGVKWSDVGAPTQSQVDRAVSVWLDEHPEATTTVEDFSLTNKKLVVGTLNFVTPEMFGAIGDGISDDTTAIQSAVNSGVKVVFNKTTYKCGKVNVKNVELDCNGASFLMTDDRLFNAEADNISQIETITAYSKGQKTIELSDLVSIGDLIEVRGTEVVNKDDQEAFSGGVAVVMDITGTTVTLSNSFDFDFAVGTDVYVYEKNSVIIKNISNITPKDTNTMYFIYATHNINSVIVNVNANYLGWGGIAISGINNTCKHCVLKNRYNRNSFNYTLALASPSLNCKVSECTIATYWHSLSIVGQYPVMGTRVENNVFNSYNNNLAYREHANGFYTIFVNNTTEGAYFSHGALINNNHFMSRSTLDITIIGLIANECNYFIENNRFDSACEIDLYGTNYSGTKITFKKNKVVSDVTVVGTSMSGTIELIESDRYLGYYNITNVIVNRFAIENGNIGNINISNTNIKTLILNNVVIYKTNSQYGCRFSSDTVVLNNVTVTAADTITTDVILNALKVVANNLTTSGSVTVNTNAFISNCNFGNINVTGGTIQGSNNQIGSRREDYKSDGTTNYYARMLNGVYTLIAM